MRPIRTPPRKSRPETLEAALGDLAEQARDQVALADLLRESLQPGLREGFAGSNLDPGGTLTVFAAAPEWAARLRFEARNMERTAGNGGWPVKRVRIRLAL
ncbi:MAG: DciA family protein [Gammaproteobacteria bacterium]|nr:DciA family protein [Gammaproteobacteria bacterium]MCY3987317.1 DciA family protein [Gammaproteobacteria bacterium]